MRWLCTILASVLALMPTASQCAHYAFNKYYTADIDVQNGTCVSHIDIDYKTLATDLLNDANPNFAEHDSMKKSPITTLMLFGLSAGIQIIQRTYQYNPKADDCRFIINMADFDIYGQPQLHMAATFKFDRGLFAKINWQHFEPKSLMSVAIDFHGDADVLKTIAKEGRL